MAAYAEYWHVPPSEVLRLPVTRRKRLIRWKERHSMIVAQQMRSKSESSGAQFTAEGLKYIWGSNVFEET
jgi:hypothetical protein